MTRGRTTFMVISSFIRGLNKHVLPGGEGFLLAPPRCSPRPSDPSDEERQFGAVEQSLDGLSTVVASEQHDGDGEMFTMVDAPPK